MKEHMNDKVKLGIKLVCAVGLFICGRMLAHDAINEFFDARENDNWAEATKTGDTDNGIQEPIDSTGIGGSGDRDSGPSIRDIRSDSSGHGSDSRD